MPDDRLDLPRAVPDVYRAVAALNRSLDIDPALHELVKIRASYLNGCAFCIDMHATQAREQGEAERRIWAVAAWAESPFFTAPERAALALTDAITLLPKAGVPDDVYAEAAHHFSDEELGNLIGGIITINAWNRIAITTHMQPPALGAPEPTA